MTDPPKTDVVKPLRILLIEDSEDDAHLILRELRRGGYEPQSLRVEDEDALQRALRGQSWDVITCDWVMPRFGSLEALALIREWARDTPVIIVSGEVDEQYAVSGLRAGARDFVSKMRLARLMPAVERELQEAADRRALARAESALRLSEEKYRSLVESTHEWIWAVDLEGRITFTNRAVATVLGYAPEECLGRKFTDFVLPEESARHWQTFEHVLSGSSVLDYEVLLVRRDGTLALLCGHALPLRDRTGKLVGTTGSASDVTERRRVEMALRKSEANLRAILNNSLQSFILTDRSGAVRAFNQLASVRAELCFTAGPLREGVRIDESIGEEYRDSFREDFQRALAGDVAVREQECRSAAGKPGWFEVSFLPVREEDSITGVCVSLLDVSARKQAEQERDRLAAALGQAAASVVITDPAGTIVYVNAACERMTGYTRSELHGHTRDFLKSPSPDADASARERRSGERRWGNVEIQRRKDGRVYAVEVVNSPVADAQGRIVGYVDLARPLERSDG
jgi:PAS domain S-box-containing protein